MTTSDKSLASMLKRRDSLLRKDNKTIPTYQEAIANLGNFLGKTILKEMTPIAKELMGLDKPLPTAPKVLWLSPADRIDGEIILKPPPNEDVIKALTHEGILEIGTTVEERFEKHCLDRIKAAKKEVEDFERYECNNRIKFALQQQQLAHDSELKQQRADLLKMFQKDREELIEESKTELQTLKRNLVSEHQLMRNREIKMSVKQIQLSSDEKIGEMTEQNSLLRSELEKMEKMVNDEVEKRKHKDWQILHEMYTEIHRQFTTKLNILRNQQNVEIRQLYLELKTKTLENEESIENSLWGEESLNSTFERETEEFIEERKPFVISLCKVEGESSDEQSPKDDTHSNCSSFKCYKHRSKPTDRLQTLRGPFESKMFCGATQAASIPEMNDINTTDVSCNILRRLGMNFNVANIEKVKDEVDNLLLNVNNKRGETKLLTVIDSLELIATEPTDTFSESKKSVEKQLPENFSGDEYKRLRKKSQKVVNSKLAIPLTTEEYLSTLTPIPKYMTTEAGNISIWDYKAMSDDEWVKLLQELDSKLEMESTDSQFINKTVTVTLPNSEESLEKFPSNIRREPSRGILRSSVEKKMDSDFLLTNEVLQTNEMQSLVNRLCQ